MPDEALAIEEETEESAKKEESVDDILANLPPGIDIDESELERSGPGLLAIVSVLFFLLCTAGLGSFTYFYLSPKLVEAQQDLEDAQSAKKTIEAQINKESTRGEEHEKKLQNIIDIAAAKSEILDFEFYINELHSIATDVAEKNQNRGGYVTIESININSGGSVSFIGNVNDLLTLADWLEAVENSDYFEGAEMKSFKQESNVGGDDINYNLNMQFIPKSIKDDSKEKTNIENNKSLDSDKNIDTNKEE